MHALIPIDVQRGFDDPVWGARCNPQAEENGKKLLKYWREKRWPIIHVRHDSKLATSPLRPNQFGNNFKEGFGPEKNEKSERNENNELIISKSVNSAFIGTDLQERLNSANIKSVVLFGITTDQCVSTTARMASNLGFQTTVVADACFCFELKDTNGGLIPAEEVHRIHLATLAKEFATVIGAKDVPMYIGYIGDT